MYYFSKRASFSKTDITSLDIRTFSCLINLLICTKNIQELRLGRRVAKAHKTNTITNKNVKSDHHKKIEAYLKIHLILQIAARDGKYAFLTNK